MAKMDQLVAPPREEAENGVRERGHSRKRAVDNDKVARRAYERFQMRGGEHGHDQDDWFEAEREVNEE